MKFLRSNRTPYAVRLAFIPFFGFLLLLLEVVLPKDYLGRACGLVDLGDIGILVMVVGGTTVGILAIFSLIRGAVGKSLSKKDVVLVILVLFVVVMAMAIVLTQLGSERRSGRSARIMTDVRVIGISQEFYYVTNGRYADTQSELASIDEFAGPLQDPFTGVEYTDKDGRGIEGGDNDSQTWSVSALLPRKEYSGFCQLTSGTLFTCSGEGCFEEKVESVGVR